MQRGIEYIDDSNQAMKFQIEELKQMQASKIKDLVSKLDSLCARQMEAQDRRTTLKNYDQDYKAFTQSIQYEQNKSIDQLALESNLSQDNIKAIQRYISSNNKIKQGLGFQNKEMKVAQIAKAQRVFTPAETKTMNDHHSKLASHLQKLMDAAIGEDPVTTEYIANPVFIPRDGHVFDRATLEDLLKSKDKAISPLNQDVSFTAADITPCNSLIRAKSQLLTIIDTEGKVAPVQEKRKFLTLQQKSNRLRIDAKLIPLIEATYEKMPDKHKVLFDIVCRDPVTNVIMDDPVLLPDGNVYDKTIAMFLLENENGVCRLNPDITFTKADITPCHFVIKVLEQLNENYKLALKMKEAEQKPQQPQVNKENGINFHFNPNELQTPKEALLQKEADLVNQIEILQKQLAEVRSQLKEFPNEMSKQKR